MKPVVSSLVALALAIAPLSAMAKPAHKTPHAKVVKGEKGEKADKDKIVSDKGKADKADKSEKIIRVKAGKKDGAAIKNVVHHASNVDLGGSGHKEPKVENGVLVAASMKAPSSTHGKGHLKTVSTKSSSEMPKLPSANAGKPSKGGAEKGARKAVEKKAAEKAESSDDSGEPTRDEETAELVARIRGKNNTSDSSASSKEKAKNVAHTAKPAPCAKDPVEIVRGPEVERFELTKCDGTVAPLAIEKLSILIRPGGAARPTAPLADLAKKPGSELAPGVRRVDPRLVDRIQAVVDHFGKGTPAKLSIISGYRPASVGSMHSSGRAIDFRVEGTRNEDVVAFCKTLGDTGCGFYPNSSFVHIDVRDAGAGHVSWIDASGPGETPRYVPVWPPPSSPAAERYLHRASATTERTAGRSMEDLAEEGANLLRAKRPFDHTGADHEPATESTDDHPALPSTSALPPALPAPEPSK